MNRVNVGFESLASLIISITFVKNKKNPFIGIVFLGSSSAGHGCFVSSICILPPNKHCEQALIATGATDSTIRLFGLDQAQPVAQLVGHSGNVSALKAGPNGLLISGSWDSTVKQWLKENCVQTMAGKTL